MILPFIAVFLPNPKYRVLATFHYGDLCLYLQLESAAYCCPYVALKDRRKDHYQSN